MPRVIPATRAALEVIDRLEAALGPLVLFQSGGCCDGSSPMCLTLGELPPGPGDEYLGTVAGVPFYIDADQYERWGRPQFELDVETGAATSFSLEGPLGVHFITRTPSCALS